MINLNKIALISCALTLLSFPAFAEENKDTPITEYRAAVDELVKSLKDDQAEKYYKIRNTHGVIRSVESVEDIVERAVKSCVENHDALGNKVEARFVDWKLAVHPTLKKGKERLEKLILLQDYAKPSDVKAHLDLFDKAATYGDNLIDHKPASDEKSCTLLLENMDKTQPDLIRLIKENTGVE